MNERKIFLAAKFSVKFYARYNVGFPNLSRGRGEGLNPHPVALALDLCGFSVVYLGSLVPGVKGPELLGT